MDRLDAEIGIEDGVATEAPPRFGASHALLAFGLMLFGQLAVGLGLVLVHMIAEIAGGANPEDPRFGSEMEADLVLPMIVAAAVISSLVVLLAVRLWAWHLVRDRSASGLGLFVPPMRQLLPWIGVGIATSLGYLFLTTLVVTQFKGGPLAKVAASGGAGRMAWAILALLFAPFIEELLFRGLMLRGLVATLGLAVAAPTVTVLFFGIHLFEAWGYWPALASIFTMSVITLLARLQTGSVVAAMGVHAAYNGMIVVAVYFAKWT